MLAVSLALPPLVRDLTPGIERKYRVSVDREGGDHYAYRLQIKVEKGKGETRVDLRLADYKANVGGNETSSRLIGGGSMALQPSGLPSGLSLASPIWLPLLSLYVPAVEEDGEFEVPKLDLTNLALTGKGTWKRPRYDTALDLLRGDREIGKITLGVAIDRAGWPDHAEGSLISADGTYRFKLEKG